jgi:ABC-type Fe3+-hydroxamate transport system substrate-binding protein
MKSEIAYRVRTPFQPWQRSQASLARCAAGLKPTRREFLIGGAAALLLAGCGSGEQAGSGGDEASGGKRTIENKFGSTQVPENPERVVEVGYNEADFVLVLGIAPVVRGKEVATLRIEPESILAYGPNSFTETVLANAHVPRPEPPASVKETFGYYEVSPELLPRMDGDIIFVYSQEPGAVEELTANPLWDDLPAVQTDLAFAVDFEHWLMRVGYSAANAILGDLEKYLVEREAGS